MKHAALVGLVLLVAGCAPPPSTGPGEVPLTDGAGNVVGEDENRPLGRLTDLPPCDPPPDATGDPLPDDLFLPPGTIVTRVEQDGPTRSIQAWAPLTPSQVRRAFEQAAGYEVITREDETYDAEVLVTDGDDRSFVEVLALCNRASRFIVVTAADPGRR